MSEFAKDLKDFMERFDTARAAWIRENGTDEGFNAWVVEKMGFKALA